MELTAIFVGRPDLTISVDDWAVEAATETFFEMGAIAVTSSQCQWSRLEYNQPKRKQKKMEVIVTDNKKNTITYGYAPEHYAGVVQFYSDLVQRGEIYTYTVKVQDTACRLDKIKWMRRGCG